MKDKSSGFKILNEIEFVHLRPEVLLGTIKKESRKIDIYNSEKKEYETKEFDFSEGFFRLFEEAITNSIDEYERNKNLTSIYVTISEDSIKIEDDGGGYPIEQHEYNGIMKWTPEWILTKLYSGTNFNDESRGNILGQNGMGISLVNFFSTEFVIRTKRANTQEYYQEFEKHSTVVYEPILEKISGNEHYTIIEFTPDLSLFPDLDKNIFNYYTPLYKEYIRKLSIIFPTIKFYFNDDRIKMEKSEFFKGILNDHIIKWDRIEDIAFGFAKDGLRQMYMVNSKPITSFTLFEDFKTNVFSLVREQLNKKYKLKIARNTWFNEHVSVVALFTGKNVRFKNQTKDIMVTFDSYKTDIKKLDINTWVKYLLDDKFLIQAFIDNYNNNINETAKKDLTKIRNEFIPALVEANNRNPEAKILIITEGKSAAGGFNVVRDTNIHSFLPIRGKTPNVSSLSLAQVMKNEVYKNIISAIQLGSQYQLRHGKVYIASDSDEDGLHIRILLIQFFSKFFPWFIEQGRLYVLEAPRYKYEINGEVKYSQTEPPSNAKNIKYYKGLGSMDKRANKDMLNSPILIKIEDVKSIMSFYDTIYKDLDQDIPDLDV